MKRLARFVAGLLVSVIVIVTFAAVSALVGALVGVGGAMIGALAAVTVGAASPSAVASVVFWCVGGLASVAVFGVLFLKWIESVSELAGKRAIGAAGVEP
jgi:hypothetical protein